MSQTPLEGLLNFWMGFDCREQPFIHAADLEFLRSHDPQHKLDSDNYVKLASNREYFNAYQDGFRHNWGPMCFAIRPTPWCGRIDSARVYILQTNPRCGPLVAIENDSNGNWAQEVLEEARQGPNPFLQVENAAVGGCQWWTHKFFPVAQKLAERRNGTLLEALDEVARAVAGLELIPYHSGTKPYLVAGLKCVLASELPSSKVMREFYEGHVVPLVESRKAIAICAHSEKEWKYKKDPGRGYFVSSSPRSLRLPVNDLVDFLLA